MKRLALILVLALPIAGCAGLTKTLDAIQGYAISQNQVDGARSTYDGTVLVPLARYASFPRCTPGTTISITNLCHDKVMLKKLRNADKAVAQAFVETQDMITSGNNSGAVAAYKTLQAAISAAQGLVAAAGVPNL